MPPTIDLTNRRFGRLTALNRSGKTRHGAVLWRTQCECGRSITVQAGSLMSGNSTSCGCSRTRHGHARKSRYSPTYLTWQAMIRRCNDPKAVDFWNYGGRGVLVCLRWESFESFLADMGDRPAGTSIDRINNDGNYEPGNCRWATAREQANNKRNSRTLEINGVRRTIAEWSRSSGIGYSTIKERILRGWSPLRAVTERIGH